MDNGDVLATTDSLKVVELGWPLLERLKNTEDLRAFEEQFLERFGQDLKPHGGSVFDYVVGNVRDAVLHEVIKKLEEQVSSLEFLKSCETFKRGPHYVPKRDWDVAIARVRDDISVIRQMVP